MVITMIKDTNNCLRIKRLSHVSYDARCNNLPM